MTYDRDLFLRFEWKSKKVAITELILNVSVTLINELSDFDFPNNRITLECTPKYPKK